MTDYSAQTAELLHSTSLTLRELLKAMPSSETQRKRGVFSKLQRQVDDLVEHTARLCVRIGL